MDGTWFGLSDQIALCGQIMEYGPVLDEIPLIGSRQRGKADKVERAVRNNEHTLCAFDVAGDRIPNPLPQMRPCRSISLLRLSGRNAGQCCAPVDFVAPSREECVQ